MEITFIIVPTTILVNSFIPFFLLPLHPSNNEKPHMSGIICTMNTSRFAEGRSPVHYFSLYAVHFFSTLIFVQLSSNYSITASWKLDHNLTVSYNMVHILVGVSGGPPIYLEK